MSAVPDYVVSTGEHVTEWMEQENIDTAALARLLDVRTEVIEGLLAGTAPLTAELADRLERVTGVPARIWNLYEAGYRGDRARQSTGEGA